MDSYLILSILIDAYRYFLVLIDTHDYYQYLPTFMGIH